MLSPETLTGGFANPVFETQALFRAVMDGLARPGTAADANTFVAPPVPLGKAAASILLALCDFEIAVWLSNSLITPDLRGWIDFHSGAPVTGTEADAAFAFVASVDELPPLDSFCQGTDEYPDTSTTIILEITSLDAGPSLALEGPGINGSTTFAPEGLPDGFLKFWQRNGALFPCGIDLILTAGNRFACLPRTTRIREA